MRILLTGCTGFVGSALGPRLVAEGHELYCVCRPGTSITFGTKVAWDGTTPIDQASFPKTIDIVVHAAQSRRYRNFPADSREMFDVNVNMTMRLLDWAARAAAKHFCLLSSGAVYEPFTGVLREDAALAPSGFLGASKLASEIVAKPFSSVFSLSILRLFFPYGPGQYDRLIPQLIRRIRDGEAIQLSGGTEGIRLAPTFIDDIVDVILASIASSWTETLNVASSEMLSIRQIANMIAQQLGVEPKFEIVNANTPPVDIVPDLGRLASRLELRRFVQFKDGLQRTMATSPLDAPDHRPAESQHRA
ncbi:nucleoside-diphosphate-sugar epimerase [Bradyrhizobium macuxiense]|uniref:Nucleoside-diphosphate-sugar epimerase n=1 Tax=Bradyrhizobium macuxiense TaxID=1755647 RepID=A0A560LNH9_9BRAD|nr:NAD(P)-dependent oxidoreductase [Bradyrhizobium macuxiense]TWB96957.1 nucleoside-diphosphate-sugar epimerase [Bradyrhizobium macuxiense]